MVKNLDKFEYDTGIPEGWDVCLWCQKNYDEKYEYNEECCSKKCFDEEAEYIKIRDKKLKRFFIIMGIVSLTTAFLISYYENEWKIFYITAFFLGLMILKLSMAKFYLYLVERFGW